MTRWKPADKETFEKHVLTCGNPYCPLHLAGDENESCSKVRADRIDAAFHKEEKRVRNVLKAELQKLGHEKFGADLYEVDGVLVRVRLDHVRTGSSFHRRPTGRYHIKYDAEGWRTKSRQQPKAGFSDAKLAEIALQMHGVIEAQRADAVRRTAKAKAVRSTDKQAARINAKLEQAAPGVDTYPLQATSTETEGRVLVLGLKWSPARAEAVQQALLPFLLEQQAENSSKD